MADGFSLNDALSGSGKPNPQGWPGSWGNQPAGAGGYPGAAYPGAYPGQGPHGAYPGQGPHFKKKKKKLKIKTMALTISK